MSDAQFNENDIEIVSHLPDLMESRGSDNDRAVLSSVLVLLGMLGGAAAATVDGYAADRAAGSQASYVDAVGCPAEPMPETSVPSIREQFRDAFTPGVIGNPPITVSVKIGEC
jgi:hypothetical protein